MEVISKSGDVTLSTVYVGKFRGQNRFLAEFVETRDPELSPNNKFVVIISTQFGCPVSCVMCDAGGNYHGDLTSEEMFSQIDYVLGKYSHDHLASLKKLKIQFARMGEPALNANVLEVLRVLPSRYDFAGLIPCIATTAPVMGTKWFKELIKIRKTTYQGRQFQLQISINSTDQLVRDKLMPVPKLNFTQLSSIAEKFYAGGPRKVGLNFALIEGVPVEPKIVAKYFDPKYSCIKITPLNPTYRSTETGFQTSLPPETPAAAENLCNEFKKFGFDVILSIGNTRENTIGSNCGMAVRKLFGDVTE